ncbi:MAG TPA: TonB-dependent receptor [bacterium]|nr:TonB-dependent receptor [bacterium]
MSGVFFKTSIFVFMFLFILPISIVFGDKYAAEEEFFAMQEQVVVSASKKAQKISDAPAAISVITAEDIEKYDYKTVAEALTQVPGLYQSTDRSNDYGIIRGIHLSDDNQKRILVLLNGHTLNNGMTMECPLGFELGVPMSAIHRIEVMRGAGSIMYGSNAFFGVINIILKNKQSTEKNFNRIDLSAGDNQLYALDAVINKPKNNLFISLQCRTNKGSDAEAFYNYRWNSTSLATYEDPYTSPSGNTLTKGTKVGDVDFDKMYSLITSYKIGKLDLLGKFSYSREGMPLADWLQIFTNNDKFEQDKSGFFELAYSDKISDKSSYSIRAYANIYDYEDKLYYHELDDTNGNVTYIDGYENLGIINGSNWVDKSKSLGQGIELKMEKVFLEGKINTIYGFEYVKNSNKSCYHSYNYFGEIADFPGLNLDWQKKTSQSFAVFEELNYKFSNNLEGLAGLRYDKITDFTGELSPRIALIYKPKDKMNYKFILGKAFRTPGYKEYKYDDGDLTENSGLKPEIIYSGDLISNFIFKNFTLTIDLFYSKFDDLIIKNDAASYDNNQNVTRSQYQNPFDITNYGVEIGLNGKHNTINYFLNILLAKNNQKGSIETYSDSVTVEKASIEDKLFNSPSVSLNGGINFEYGLFNYGVIAKYISSRKLAQSSGLDYSIGEEYPDKTKSNTLVDFNIKTAKKYNGFSFAVAVKDVFDSKREEPVRNISSIILTKTEGRKIIGKATFEF